MGQSLCGSSDKSPGNYKNHGPKDEEIVRFFMTGMGSAGKSTFIRHLIYLCSKNSNYKYCNEDWSVKKATGADDTLWRNTIRENIINALDIFISQVETNQDSFETDEVAAFAKSIQHLYVNKAEIPSVEMSDLFREHLVTLLKDRAIVNAMQMRNKLKVADDRSLFDGLDHFFKEEKLKEVFYSSYVPTEEDKIHCRLPTVDVQKYYFMLNKIKIEIYDVGGQSSERAKLVDYLSRWNTSSKLSNRNFILFVASLADYNVQHPKYPDQTLLNEAHALLNHLLNNDHTQHCGVLIFFNKKDRFREKLADPRCKEDISFISSFMSAADLREYRETGKYKKESMYNAASGQIVQDLRERFPNKNSYLRYTCAIDAKSMETFFNVIKNEILEEKFATVLL